MEGDLEVRVLNRGTKRGEGLLISAERVEVANKGFMNSF